MNFQSLCEIKEEPHEVIFIGENQNGDLSTDISSIIRLVSHSSESPVSSVNAEFDIAKSQNPLEKIPNKQHNILCSQSEVMLGYGPKIIENTVNSQFESAQPLNLAPKLSGKQQSFVNVQSEEITSSYVPKNPEHAAIPQFVSTKTLDPVSQLPKKRHSSHYAQSKKLKTSYGPNDSEHIIRSQFETRKILNKDLILPKRQCGSKYPESLEISSYGQKYLEHIVMAQSEPPKTWKQVLQLPEKQQSSLTIQSKSMPSHSPKDSENTVIAQFGPIKAHINVPQVPEKQYSSYYSPLKGDKTSYTKSTPSLNPVYMMNYNDHLSNSNDSPLDLPCITLTNAEIIPQYSVIAPSKPTYKQNPVHQLPEKDKSYAYSESRKVNSSYPQSHTFLNSHTGLDLDHELSILNDSPLDLTNKTLKSKERRKQIKKPVPVPLRNGPSEVNKSSATSPKKPAEKYKIIKEQNKKRSQKYRLSYKEKLKQNEHEYETLQEKNIILQAQFIRLKQQRGKLLSVFPCFTGSCTKELQQQKHIKEEKNYDNLVNISEKTKEPVLVNSHLDRQIDSHIDRMCETNKCLSFKSLKECTNFSDKEHLSSNHYLKNTIKL